MQFPASINLVNHNNFTLDRLITTKNQQRQSKTSGIHLTMSINKSLKHKYINIDV